MANVVLGEKLRLHRNRKGWTQAEVAKMLGLKNKSTLGSWEIGKSEPDADTFLRICTLYGIEDIVGEFLAVRPGKMLPWHVPLTTAYEKADRPIREAACRVLNIDYVEPSSRNELLIPDDELERLKQSALAQIGEGADNDDRISV